MYNVLKMYGSKNRSEKQQQNKANEAFCFVPASLVSR
jgi:hypothetical protein